MKANEPRSQQAKETIPYIEEPLTAPTKNPWSEMHYDKGYDAFHSGDYRKAIRYYRRAIEIDPKFVYAYDNCGVCYRRLGDLNSAANLYRESIRIYPKGNVAHANLAVVYALRGMTDEAKREYEEITKNDPQNPEAPYGLTVAYLKSGMPGKALESPKRSLKLCERYQPQGVGGARCYVGQTCLGLNDGIRWSC